MHGRPWAWAAVWSRVEEADRPWAWTGLGVGLSGRGLEWMGAQVIGGTGRESERLIGIKVVGEVRRGRSWVWAWMLVLDKTGHGRGRLSEVDNVIMSADKGRLSRPRVLT